MTILSTLNIASEAMQAQQQALQTTGHNISNAATPGYSRQRADMTSAFPLQQGTIILGQGVKVAEIRSVVDKFLEAQLTSLKGGVGFADAQSRPLASVQELFPTDGQSGIGAALQAFFSALSDLSINPGGKTERVQLIATAQALGNAFAETRSGLVSAQTNLDKDLHGKVSELDALLPQIADLNREIAASEVSGNPANDLRDQRQLLLQQVSSLTGATIQESANGQVSVVAGNMLLIRGDRAGSLDDSNLGSSGFRQILYRTRDGTSFDATSLLNQGEIGGLLATRDAELPALIDRIDQLAKTLVDGVNSQHASGFDLNSAAGGNFFDPIASVSGAAAQVRVTSAITADPSLIAAAQDAGGVPGDNRNALALANLGNAPFASLGNSTFNDYFLSLEEDIGGKAQNSQSASDFQSSLLNQAQVQRDAASGVNMDEEMTNLIQFQRAFQAASLLVQKGNEVYQSILDMVK